VCGRCSPFISIITDHILFQDPKSRKQYYSPFHFRIMQISYALRQAFHSMTFISSFIRIRIEPDVHKHMSVHEH